VIARCWIGVVVLAVILALGVRAYSGGLLDPGHPRESQCSQGDALRLARLLDQAEATYARAEDGGSHCAGLDKVESTEAKAEERFAKAAAYAAAPASPTTTQQAIVAFTAGLDLDPFDAGASLGLSLELREAPAAPKQRCEAAAKLVRDGLLTIAAAAVADGLKGEPVACEEALSALERQQERAADDLAKARGLGHTAAARMVYAEALQADANLAAARSGLEASIDDESVLDRIGAWLADIPNTLKTALTWFVPLGAILVALALAAWMAIRFAATRWSWARKAFERAGSHPGLRTFLYKAAVPEIQIQAFKGKGEGELEGVDFSTLLKGEIYESTARGPAFPPDRVVNNREPDAKDAVKVADLLAEIPATQLLGAVIKFVSKLFRRRQVVITGHLAPRADKGAGVLLSIAGGRKREESFTLWELVYTPNPGGDGAVRWLRLVPAATIWARWHLAWAQDPTKDFETGPWEVEALLESAEAWQRKDQPDRAETLYAAALEKDPGLLPASHNLAVLEIRRGNYAAALKRLRALRKTLADGEQGPCGRAAGELELLWPTLDTASLYTLMLTLAYPQIDRAAPARREALTEAIRTARGLASTVAGELLPAEEGTAARRKPELQALYTAIEHPSIVVLASLLVRTGPEDTQARAVEEAVRGGDGQLLTRAQIRDRVQSLEPWSLIHAYVEKEANVPRRTQYNLACYYTTLLGHADLAQGRTLQALALAALEAGLVGGELVEWADTDPSLAPLKRVAGYKFERVLAASRIEPYSDDREPQGK
jgi:tetratricopeptide (TPR) repeat protein